MNGSREDDILGERLSRPRAGAFRLSEAQAGKSPNTGVGIEDYPRLIQLARAGLVPDDQLWKMLNILKDPWKFGVSPKVRNQLYDLMVKTLNWIVTSDPAAWARYRAFLMNEEKGMDNRHITQRIKRQLQEERGRILQSLDEARAAKRPGETWESSTGDSWAGKNKDGVIQYFPKSSPDAQSKAKDFASGKMSVEKAKQMKGQEKFSKAKKDVAGEIKKGTARAVVSRKATLDGPDSEKEALGSNPKLEKKIATRIDKFAQVLIDREKRRKAGEDVGEDPKFDLCTISIPGTNLFCDESLEIPRKKMPQLKTKVTPGSKAEELLKKQLSDKGKEFDPNAEVDAEGAFLDHLKAKGVKVTTGETMNATEMKATQNELVGAKVVSMANALSRPEEVGLTPEQAAKARKALTAPLIVSRDGYVLDGHHRWGAAVVSDLLQGKGDSPTKIPVVKVDMDIEELLDDSNSWGNEFGLERKTAQQQVSGEDKKAKKEEAVPTAGEQLHESLSNTIRNILKDELSKFSLYG